MSDREEWLEEKLEYVKAHQKEIHCFGERNDGSLICIIHGEVTRPVGLAISKKIHGQHVLDQFNG